MKGTTDEHSNVFLTFVFLTTGAADPVLSADFAISEPFSSNFFTGIIVFDRARLGLSITAGCRPLISYTSSRWNHNQSVRTVHEAQATVGCLLCK